MSERAAMPTDSLRRFCARVGIDRCTMQDAESLPGYHLLTDVSSDDIRGLSRDCLEDLSDDFGTALDLTIGPPGGPPVIRIIAGQIFLDIGRVLTGVKQIDGEVQIDLTLNKDLILEQRNLDSDAYHAIVYLFEPNLLQLLGGTLLDLDKHVFPHRDKRTVILLLDTDISWEGALLTMVGPNQVPAIRGTLGPIDTSVRQRIERYHQIAFEELNWVGFRFKHLTPLHLLCIDSSNASIRPSEKMAAILRRHLFQATILYTATRSVYQEDDFLASYASSEQTTTLALTSDPIPEDRSDTLVRFALWPYVGGKTDRLTIFQAVAARDLQTLDSEDNYRVFTRQIEQILQEARWNHRVYISGEIDKHFEQVQRVMGYVSGVAQDISESVDAITRGLGETLLATIGVLVTTLLGTLIKGEISRPLFRLGAQAYTVYIAFQLLYRMSGILYSHRVLSIDADEQMGTYEEVLGRDQVAELLSPLSRRNRQFYVWFGITVALYVLLAVGMWQLSKAAIPYLDKQGMISPIATPGP